MRAYICNLKFGIRLAAGFGIIGILLLLTGMFAIRQAYILADVTERLHRHPFAVSTAARDVRAGIYAIHRDMKDVALARDARAPNPG